MPHFSILSIKTEGDVANPMVMGQHYVDFNITNVELEKYGNDDVHYIVTIAYEHSANNNLIFKLKVTTTWLIVKLNQDELERAKAFVRHLLIRSTSVFHGVLDTKIKEKGWTIRLKEDPDLQRAIELTNDLVDKYYKS